jgi:hypothetical protein
MLVVNIDSLQRNVSVGIWFEIHEMEKNDFTKADLNQTFDTGMYRRLLVMFVKLCICPSKHLLYKLKLRTLCGNFLEKLELFSSNYCIC